MSAIRVGSAVRVSWPSDTVTTGFRERYDGKVGVVLSDRGLMADRDGVDQLFGVLIHGEERMTILGMRHLSLLRPDLEEFIHDSKFALTGDDVVYDHLGKQRYALAS